MRNQWSPIVWSQLFLVQMTAVKQHAGHVRPYWYQIYGLDQREVIQMYPRRIHRLKGHRPEVPESLLAGPPIWRYIL